MQTLDIHERPTISLYQIMIVPWPHGETHGWKINGFTWIKNTIPCQHLLKAQVGDELTRQKSHQSKFLLVLNDLDPCQLSQVILAVVVDSHLKIGGKFFEFVEIDLVGITVNVLFYPEKILSEYGLHEINEHLRLHQFSKNLLRHIGSNGNFELVDLQLRHHEEIIVGINNKLSFFPFLFG